MSTWEASKDTNSVAEGFVNSPLWSGSFYTDQALDLLRDRFDELMRERKRCAEGVKTPVPNLGWTGAHYGA